MKDRCRVLAVRERETQFQVEQLFHPKCINLRNLVWHGFLVPDTFPHHLLVRPTKSSLRLIHYLVSDASAIKFFNKRLT